MDIVCEFTIRKAYEPKSSSARRLSLLPGHSHAGHCPCCRADARRLAHWRRASSMNILKFKRNSNENPTKFTINSYFNEIPMEFQWSCGPLGNSSELQVTFQRNSDRTMTFHRNSNVILVKFQYSSEIRWEAGGKSQSREQGTGSGLAAVHGPGAWQWLGSRDFRPGGWTPDQLHWNSNEIQVQV